MHCDDSNNGTANNTTQKVSGLHFQEVRPSFKAIKQKSFCKKIFYNQIFEWVRLKKILGGTGGTIIQIQNVQGGTVIEVLCLFQT